MESEGATEGDNEEESENMIYSLPKSRRKLLKNCRYRALEECQVEVTTFSAPHDIL